MKRTAVCTIVAAALAGCASTPVIESVNKSYDETTATVAAANAAMAGGGRVAAIVLPTLDVPYLSRKSVPRGSYKAELPLVMRSNTPVHISTRSPVTAQQFARLLSEEFKLSVKAETVAPATPGAAPAPAAASPAAQEQTPPPNGAKAAPAMASGIPAPRTLDLASLPPMPLRDLVTTGTQILGIDWDWQDNTLLLQAAFTRSYPISASAETSSGKTDTGKNGSTTTGSTGSSAGNFTNELKAGTAYAMDNWAELSATLQQIAGAGNVVAGKSFNVATVTCSKACHRIVKQFLDNVNHSLSQQVLFKVQEVTISSSVSGESGVDWNVIYRTVVDGRKFRLGLSTPTSLVGSASGLIQNILIPTDAANPTGADGSSLIIKALSTASKYVDVKPYSAVVINNESVSLNNTAQQSYTQSYTVVPSTVLGGQPTLVGNPGYVTFGQILQLRPTILPDGTIRVSFSLDDTSGKVDKGVAGAIDSVTLSAVNVGTKVIVKPGSTMVLASTKRTTQRFNNQGLLVDQQVGSKTGSNDTTETVVLITPYLANAGAL